MASDFIHPTSGWAANEFIAASRQLRAAIDQMEKAFAIASHYNNSGDFAALAAATGVSSSEAQTLFDMLNGALGAIKGTGQNAQSVAFIDRVG